MIEVFCCVMDKDGIRLWLKAIGQDRHWLAAKLGVTKRGVDSWLSSSRPIPKSAERIIPQLMELYAEGNGKVDDSISLVLSVDSGTFDRWNAAATKEGKLIRQWAVDVLDREAEFE